MNRFNKTMYDKCEKTNEGGANDVDNIVIETTIADQVFEGIWFEQL